MHSKITMYITSTVTSPVTKTAKTSKWLRLKMDRKNFVAVSEYMNFRKPLCILSIWRHFYA